MSKADEIIIDKGKQIEGNIIIHRAKLIQYCKKCNKQHVYFCMGGVIFGKNIFQ